MGKESDATQKQAEERAKPVPVTPAITTEDYNAARQWAQQGSTADQHLPGLELVGLQIDSNIGQKLKGQKAENDASAFVLEFINLPLKEWDGNLASFLSRPGNARLKQSWEKVKSTHQDFQAAINKNMEALQQRAKQRLPDGTRNDQQAIARATLEEINAALRGDPKAEPAAQRQINYELRAAFQGKDGRSGLNGAAIAFGEQLAARFPEADEESTSGSDSKAALERNAKADGVIIQRDGERVKQIKVRDGDYIIAVRYDGDSKEPCGFQMLGKDGKPLQPPIEHNGQFEINEKTGALTVIDRTGEAANLARIETIYNPEGKVEQNEYNDNGLRTRQTCTSFKPDEDTKTSTARSSTTSYQYFAIGKLGQPVPADNPLAVISAIGITTNARGELTQTQQFTSFAAVELNQPGFTQSIERQPRLDGVQTETHTLTASTAANTPAVTGTIQKSTNHNTGERTLDEHWETEQTGQHLKFDAAGNAVEFTRQAGDDKYTYRLMDGQVDAVFKNDEAVQGDEASKLAEAGDKIIAEAVENAGITSYKDELLQSFGDRKASKAVRKQALEDLQVLQERTNKSERKELGAIIDMLKKVEDEPRSGDLSSLAGVATIITAGGRFEKNTYDDNGLRTSQTTGTIGDAASQLTTKYIYATSDGQEAKRPADAGMVMAETRDSNDEIVRRNTYESFAAVETNQPALCETIEQQQEDFKNVELHTYENISNPDAVQKVGEISRTEYSRSGVVKIHSEMLQQGVNVVEDARFKANGDAKSYSRQIGEAKIDYKISDGRVVGVNVTNPELLGIDSANAQTNRALIAEGGFLLAQMQDQYKIKDADTADSVRPANAEELAAIAKNTNPASGTLVMRQPWSGAYQSYRVDKGKIFDAGKNKIGTFKNNGDVEFTDGRPQSRFNIMTGERAAFHGKVGDGSSAIYCNMVKPQPDGLNGIISDARKTDRSYQVVDGNVFEGDKFLGHIDKTGAFHFDESQQGNAGRPASLAIARFTDARFEGTDNGKPPNLRRIEFDKSAPDGKMFIPDADGHPVEHEVHMGMVINKQTGEQLGILTAPTVNPDRSLSSGSIKMINGQELPLSHFTNTSFQLTKPGEPAAQIGAIHIEGVALGPQMILSDGQADQNTGGLFSLAQAREADQKRMQEGKQARQAYEDSWSLGDRLKGDRASNLHILKFRETCDLNKHNRLEQDAEALMSGTYNGEIIERLRVSFNISQGDVARDDASIKKQQTDTAQLSIESLPEDTTQINGTVNVPLFDDNGKVIAQQEYKIVAGVITGSDGKEMGRIENAVDAKTGKVTQQGLLKMRDPNNPDNEIQTLGELKGAFWNITVPGSYGQTENINWVSLGAVRDSNGNITSKGGIVSTAVLLQQTNKEIELARAMYEASGKSEKTRAALDQTADRVTKLSNIVNEITEKGIPSDSVLNYLARGAKDIVRADVYRETTDTHKLERVELPENMTGVVGRLRTGDQVFAIKDGNLYKSGEKEPVARLQRGDRQDGYEVQYIANGHKIDLTSQAGVLLQWKGTDGETHNLIALGPGAVTGNYGYQAGGLVDITQLKHEASEAREAAEHHNAKYFAERPWLTGALTNFLAADAEGVMEKLMQTIGKYEAQIDEQIGLFFGSELGNDTNFDHNHVPDGFNTYLIQSGPYLREGMPGGMADVSAESLDSRAGTIQIILSAMNSTAGDFGSLCQQISQLQEQVADSLETAVVTVATAGAGTYFSAALKAGRMGRTAATLWQLGVGVGAGGAASTLTMSNDSHGVGHVAGGAIKGLAMSAPGALRTYKMFAGGAEATNAALQTEQAAARLAGGYNPLLRRGMQMGKHALKASGGMMADSAFQTGMFANADWAKSGLDINEFSEIYNVEKLALGTGAMFLAQAVGHNLGHLTDKLGDKLGRLVAGTGRGQAFLASSAGQRILGSQVDLTGRATLWAFKEGEQRLASSVINQMSNAYAFGASGAMRDVITGVKQSAAETLGLMTIDKHGNLIGDASMVSIRSKLFSWGAVISGMHEAGKSAMATAGLLAYGSHKVTQHFIRKAERTTERQSAQRLEQLQKEAQELTLQMQAAEQRGHESPRAVAGEDPSATVVATAATISALAGGDAPVVAEGNASTATAEAVKTTAARSGAPPPASGSDAPSPAAASKVSDGNQKLNVHRQQLERNYSEQLNLKQSQLQREMQKSGIADLEKEAHNIRSGLTEQKVTLELDPNGKVRATGDVTPDKAQSKAIERLNQIHSEIDQRAHEHANGAIQVLQGDIQKLQGEMQAVQLALAAHQAGPELARLQEQAQQIIQKLPEAERLAHENPSNFESQQAVENLRQEQEKNYNQQLQLRLVQLQHELNKSGISDLLRESQDIHRTLSTQKITLESDPVDPNGKVRVTSDVTPDKAQSKAIERLNQIHSEIDQRAHEHANGAIQVLQGDIQKLQGDLQITEQARAAHQAGMELPKLQEQAQQISSRLSLTEEPLRSNFGDPEVQRQLADHSKALASNYEQQLKLNQALLLDAYNKSGVSRLIREGQYIQSGLTAANIILESYSGYLVRAANGITPTPAQLEAIGRLNKINSEIDTLVKTYAGGTIATLVQQRQMLERAVASQKELQRNLNWQRPGADKVTEPHQQGASVPKFKENKRPGRTEYKTAAQLDFSPDRRQGIEPGDRIKESSHPLEVYTPVIEPPTPAKLEALNKSFPQYNNEVAERLSNKLADVRSKWTEDVTEKLAYASDLQQQVREAHAKYANRLQQLEQQQGRQLTAREVERARQPGELLHEAYQERQKLVVQYAEICKEVSNVVDARRKDLQNAVNELIGEQRARGHDLPDITIVAAKHTHVAGSYIFGTGSVILPSESLHVSGGREELTTTVFHEVGHGILHDRDIAELAIRQAARSGRTVAEEYSNLTGSKLSDIWDRQLQNFLDHRDPQRLLDEARVRQVASEIKHSLTQISERSRELGNTARVIASQIESLRNDPLHLHELAEMVSGSEGKALRQRLFGSDDLAAIPLLVDSPGGTPSPDVSEYHDALIEFLQGRLKEINQEHKSLVDAYASTITEGEILALATQVWEPEDIQLGESEAARKSEPAANETVEQEPRPSRLARNHAIVAEVLDGVSRGQPSIPRAEQHKDAKAVLRDHAEAVERRELETARLGQDLNIPDRAPERLEKLTQLVVNTGQTRQATERHLKPELVSLTPQERNEKFKELGITDQETFWEKAMTPAAKIEMAVYKVKGHDQLEIHVPTEHIQTLNRVRELRLVAEGAKGKQGIYPSFAQQNKARRVLESDPRYRNAVLPEDVIKHLNELPDGGKMIKQIVLSDTPDPENAWITVEYLQGKQNDFGHNHRSKASASHDLITFYPSEQHQDSSSLGRCLSHEWAHLLEDKASAARAAFSAATHLENDSGNKGHFYRQYATRNNSEDWAVHLGEVFLGNGNEATDHFVNMVQVAKANGDSKLKVLAITKAIRDVLAETETGNQKQPDREQLKARVEYAERELGGHNDETRQELIERLANPQTSKENALNVARVLAGIGNKLHAQQLIDLAKTQPDPEIACAMLHTAGQLGDRSHAEQMIEMAGSVQINDARLARALLDSARRAYGMESLPAPTLIKLSSLAGPIGGCALDLMTMTKGNAGPTARANLIARIESGEIPNLVKEGKIAGGDELLYHATIMGDHTEQTRVFQAIVKHLSDKPALMSDYLAGLVLEDHPVVSKLACRELLNSPPEDPQSVQILREVADNPEHAWQLKALEILRKVGEKIGLAAAEDALSSAVNVPEPDSHAKVLQEIARRRSSISGLITRFEKDIAGALDLLGGIDSSLRQDIFGSDILPEDLQKHASHFAAKIDADPLAASRCLAGHLARHDYLLIRDQIRVEKQLNGQHAKLAASGETPTLVVMDVQTSGDSLCRDVFGPQFVPEVIRLIEQAKENEWPIVVLEFSERGPTDQRILEAVKDYDKHQVRRKSKYDGSTEVMKVCEEHGFPAHQFILCGTRAGLCVKKTVEGLLARETADINITVVKKATADLPGEQHQYDWNQFPTDPRVSLEDGQTPMHTKGEPGAKPGAENKQAGRTTPANRKQPSIRDQGTRPGQRKPANGGGHKKPAQNRTEKVTAPTNTDFVSEQQQSTDSDRGMIKRRYYDLGDRLLPVAKASREHGDKPVYELSASPDSQWFYLIRDGKRDWSKSSSSSRIKAHIVTTGSGDKVAELQKVVINALLTDPELRSLTSAAKTFDPHHGLKLPDAHGAAPTGDRQLAKLFTIYFHSPEAAVRGAARFDQIISQHADLCLPKQHGTGDVDEITGMANRVGLVIDRFQEATNDYGELAVVIPPLVERYLRTEFKLPADKQLTPSDTSRIEAACGLREGTISYGHLTRQEGGEPVKYGSKRLVLMHGKQPDYGDPLGPEPKPPSYLTAGGAGNVFGDYSDRMAMYALIGRYQISPSELAIDAVQAPNPPAGTEVIVGAKDIQVLNRDISKEHLALGRDQNGQLYVRHLDPESNTYIRLPDAGWKLHDGSTDLPASAEVQVRSGAQAGTYYRLSGAGWAQIEAGKSTTVPEGTQVMLGAIRRLRIIDVHQPAGYNAQMPPSQLTVPANTPQTPPTRRKRADSLIPEAPGGRGETPAAKRRGKKPGSAEVRRDAETAGPGKLQSGETSRPRVFANITNIESYIKNAPSLELPSNALGRYRQLQKMKNAFELSKTGFLAELEKLPQITSMRDDNSHPDEKMILQQFLDNIFDRPGITRGLLKRSGDDSRLLKQYEDLRVQKEIIENENEYFDGVIAKCHTKLQNWANEITDSAGLPRTNVLIEELPDAYGIYSIRENAIKIDEWFVMSESNVYDTLMHELVHLDQSDIITRMILDELKATGTTISNKVREQSQARFTELTGYTLNNNFLDAVCKARNNTPLNSHETDRAVKLAASYKDLVTNAERRENNRRVSEMLQTQLDYLELEPVSLANLSRVADVLGKYLNQSKRTDDAGMQDINSYIHSAIQSYRKKVRYFGDTKLPDFVREFEADCKSDLCTTLIVAIAAINADARFIYKGRYHEQEAKAIGQRATNESAGLSTTAHLFSHSESETAGSLLANVNGDNMPRHGGNATGNEQISPPVEQDKQAARKRLAIDKTVGPENKSTGSEYPYWAGKVDSHIHNLAEALSAATKQKSPESIADHQSKIITAMLDEARRTRMFEKMGIPPDAISPDMISIDIFKSSPGAYDPSTNKLSMNPLVDRAPMQTFRHEIEHMRQAVMKTAMRNADSTAFDTHVLDSVLNNVGTGTPRFNMTEIEPGMELSVCQKRAILSDSGKHLLREAIKEHVNKNLEDSTENMLQVLEQKQYAKLRNEKAFREAGSLLEEFAAEIQHFRLCDQLMVIPDTAGTNKHFDGMLARETARLRKKKGDGSLYMDPEMTKATKNISDSLTAWRDHSTYLAGSQQEFGARRAEMASWALRNIADRWRSRFPQLESKWLREITKHEGRFFIQAIKHQNLFQKISECLDRSRSATSEPERKQEFAKAHQAAMQILEIMRDTEMTASTRHVIKYLFDQNIVSLTEIRHIRDWLADGLDTSTISRPKKNMLKSLIAGVLTSVNGETAKELSRKRGENSSKRKDEANEAVGTADMSRVAGNEPRLPDQSISQSRRRYLESRQGKLNLNLLGCGYLAKLAKQTRKTIGSLVSRLCFKGTPTTLTTDSAIAGLITQPTDDSGGKQASPGTIAAEQGTHSPSFTAESAGGINHDMLKAAFNVKPQMNDVEKRVLKSNIESSIQLIKKWLKPLNAPSSEILSRLSVQEVNRLIRQSTLWRSAVGNVIKSKFGPELQNWSDINVLLNSDSSETTRLEAVNNLRNFFNELVEHINIIKSGSCEQEALQNQQKDSGPKPTESIPQIAPAKPALELPKELPTPAERKQLLLELQKMEHLHDVDAINAVLHNDEACGKYMELKRLVGAIASQLSITKTPTAGHQGDTAAGHTDKIHGKALERLQNEISKIRRTKPNLEAHEVVACLDRISEQIKQYEKIATAAFNEGAGKEQKELALSLIEHAIVNPHISVDVAAVFHPGASLQAVKGYALLLENTMQSDYRPGFAYGYKAQSDSVKLIADALDKHLLKTGKNGREQKWVIVPTQYSSPADHNGWDAVLICLDTGQLMIVDLAAKDMMQTKTAEAKRQDAVLQQWRITPNINPKAKLEQVQEQLQELLSTGKAKASQGNIQYFNIENDKFKLDGPWALAQFHAVRGTIASALEKVYKSPSVLKDAFYKEHTNTAFVLASVLDHIYPRLLDSIICGKKSDHAIDTSTIQVGIDQYGNHYIELPDPGYRTTITGLQGKSHSIENMTLRLTFAKKGYSCLVAFREIQIDNIQAKRVSEITIPLGHIDEILRDCDRQAKSTTFGEMLYAKGTDGKKTTGSVKAAAEALKELSKKGKPTPDQWSRFFSEYPAIAVILQPFMHPEIFRRTETAPAAASKLPEALRKQRLNAHDIDSYLKEVSPRSQEHRDELAELILKVRELKRLEALAGENHPHLAQAISKFKKEFSNHDIQNMLNNLEFLDVPLMQPVQEYMEQTITEIDELVNYCGQPRNWKEFNSRIENIDLDSIEKHRQSVLAELRKLGVDPAVDLNWAQTLERLTHSQVRSIDPRKLPVQATETLLRHCQSNEPLSLLTDSYVLELWAEREQLRQKDIDKHIDNLVIQKCLLSPEQVRLIDLTTLSHEGLDALMTSSTVRFVTPGQIKSLSSESVEFIVSNYLPVLSAPQAKALPIQKLEPAQIAALPLETVALMPAAILHNLTNQQRAALTKEQWHVLAGHMPLPELKMAASRINEKYGHQINAKAARQVLEIVNAFPGTTGSALVKSYLAGKIDNADRLLWLMGDLEIGPAIHAALTKLAEAASPDQILHLKADEIESMARAAVKAPQPVEGFFPGELALDRRASFDVVRAAAATKLAAEAILNAEQIPDDKPLVVLGRGMEPLVAVLRSRRRDARYFLYSRLQVVADNFSADDVSTQKRWLEEIPRGAVVIDTGFRGTILTAINKIDQSIIPYHLCSHPETQIPQLLQANYPDSHATTVNVAKAVEGTPHLRGRSTGYTDEGMAVTRWWLNDQDASHEETMKSREIKDFRRAMFKALGLPPWYAWRYASFTGVSPVERTGSARQNRPKKRPK